MTATLSRERGDARPSYTIERLNDNAAIRDVLMTDDSYTAYALAQLDPDLFRLAEWYVATSGEARALLLHSRGGLGRALFALGDSGALNALLGLHPGPRFSFGSFRPEHRRVVERYFMLTRPQTMLRMSVAPAGFKPIEREAVRLTGRDIASVNRLYATEGGSSTYQARHIEDGVYFGVFVDNLLISIAGTHVVSASEGVAVVGNVFTHPLYRGQGLGAVATSATTAHLLERCPLVVLTVEEENLAAVRIYQRLGYETQCTLHETPLIRKEPIGAVSFVRRVIAGWRGRAAKKEVVIG